MTEVRTGIRSVLSHPWVYDAAQRVFGANRSRRVLVDRHIRPREGDRILDIGCGTGEMVRFLPADTMYWGFGPSASYIDSARRRHGSRGSFVCADLNSHELGV